MKVAVVFSQAIENDTSSMIRCRNIINELPGLGHTVVCFSPYPDEDSIYFNKLASISEDILIFRYGHPIVKKNDRINGRKEPSKLRKFIKRFDLFGSSIKNVRYRKYMSNMISDEECDIILSFSDPKSAHIIAGYCKKKNKKMYYIQQWGDPLAMDITNQSALPLFVRRFIEKMLLARADKICYVSPLTCTIQKKVFTKNGSKMIFLPTPCEMVSYTSAHGQKPVFGYFGSYKSVARDILPLYKAFQNCKTASLMLVGDSDIVLEETESVLLVNRVTQAELNDYMEKVDVLICVLNRRGTQIPGKLYNYAGTNKEILVVVDGEYGTQIQDFFQQFGRYSFVENNVTSICAKIEEYVTNGVPDRKPLDEFAPKKVAAKLISNSI